MTSLNTRFGISSGASWTPKEDAILNDNYTIPWSDLLALLPGRSRGAVQVRMSIKQLKRVRPRHHAAWSDEDAAYLHDSYGKVPNEELEVRLDRSIHTISEYARRQGLSMSKNEDGRTINNLDNPTLKPLIEGGLQGYYWMGYLMADGYMHHGLKQVVLVSAVKDGTHLKRYAAFLKTKAHRYTGVAGWTGKPYDTYRISVADTVNATKLISMYDWKPRKTYNPPSSDVLAKTLADPDAFCAFLIGFIDGDGYINKGNLCIKLENHASWTSFHDFALDMLRGFGILATSVKAKLNARGYAQAIIPKTTTLWLKAFINRHNLIVLTRKWNKVKQSYET